MIRPFDPAPEHVMVLARHMERELRSKLHEHLSRSRQHLHVSGPAASVITTLINEGWAIDWSTQAADHYLVHPDHERIMMLSDLEHAYALFVLARGSESGERNAAIQALGRL